MALGFQRSGLGAFVRSSLGARNKTPPPIAYYQCQIANSFIGGSIVFRCFASTSSTTYTPGPFTVGGWNDTAMQASFDSIGGGQGNPFATVFDPVSAAALGGCVAWASPLGTPYVGQDGDTYRAQVITVLQFGSFKYITTIGARNITPPTGGVDGLGFFEVCTLGPSNMTQNDMCGAAYSDWDTLFGYPGFTGGGPIDPTSNHAIDPSSAFTAAFTLANVACFNGTNCVAASPADCGGSC